MADFVSQTFPGPGPEFQNSTSDFVQQVMFTGDVAPVVNYVQRVFSSGLGVWCYYTMTVIDQSPASGDTTPNWTGAITAYELLGTT
jgi:hypothetical protein